MPSKSKVVPKHITIYMYIFYHSASLTLNSWFHFSP